MNLDSLDLAINGGPPVRTKPWLDNFTTGIEEKEIVMKVMEENGARGAYHDKGAVLNPRTQTMFNDPIMRTYSFEWDIAPKNASESNDVENIIRKLKYHGAPSLAKEDGSIYAYPSEFQVLFFSKGGENKFIGRYSRSGP